MRVVIADDEPLARALLRTFIAEAGDVVLVGEAENGREAVAVARRLDADVVFLDIDMAGGSGINAALELIGSGSADVVFVTAHSQFAADAYDLGALDYVLKPLRRPRVAKALERAKIHLRDKRSRAGGGASLTVADPEFWVGTRLGKVRVPASDILWIEAARDHVYLHTSGGSYLYRSTMTRLEEELLGTALARTGRSSFVNLDKVTRVIRRRRLTRLEIGAAAIVGVGRNHRAAILARLASQAAASS